MMHCFSEMFDKQQANSIFWSPQGQFLVLAGLRR
uniref:Translation initiation factor beta propellor-like domain-containing protein n=1 Tax=Anguilla anguilla TaxID=7936 RepID=A0A0E9TLP5_ANGAN